jgi:hypothetical protein
VDQERFDRMTKQLATGQSRRGVLKGLGAAALGALGLQQTGALAKGGKTRFCHQNDNGTYEYITVSESAAVAHRAHGDVENPIFATNVLHCGSCGNACTAAPTNATASCVGGTCGFTCETGYQRNATGDGCVPTDPCAGKTCDPAPDACHTAGTCNSSSGICSPPVPTKNFASDSRNCGSCGHNCSDEKRFSQCNGGTCQCPADFHDCDDECKRLCSADPDYYQARFQTCYNPGGIAPGNCAYCTSWAGCYGSFDSGVAACGTVTHESCV